MRHDQPDRIGILFENARASSFWLIVHFFHCCIYLFPRPSLIYPLLFITRDTVVARYTLPSGRYPFKVAIFCLYTPFQIRNIPLPLVL